MSNPTFFRNQYYNPATGGEDLPFEADLGYVGEDGSWKEERFEAVTNEDDGFFAEQVKEQYGLVKCEVCDQFCVPAAVDPDVCFHCK